DSLCGLCGLCGSKPPHSIFGERIVDETVQPSLTGFGRRNHGMLAGAGVLARVVVPRGIAAQGHSARLARAEVDPVVPALDALFAFVASSGLDVSDAFDVRARIWHTPE